MRISGKNMQRRRGRPRIGRRIGFEPPADYFKPRGTPLSVLEEVELSKEEVEAMRLRYLENLTQEKAADSMDVSQSTFQRILASANHKTAKALIRGCAIRINDQL